MVKVKVKAVALFVQSHSSRSSLRLFCHFSTMTQDVGFRQSRLDSTVVMNRTTKGSVLPSPIQEVDNTSCPIRPLSFNREYNYNYG
jgi:hypothetical protein